MSIRTAITGAVALAAALAATWLLWQIVHVLLVIFAGVLLAVIWRNLGVRLADISGMADRLGTIVVILLTLVGAIGAVWAVGPTLGGQLDELLESLPEAFSRLEEALRRTGWGRWLLESALPSLGDGGSGGDLLGQISGMFSTALGVLGNAIVILMVGIYTAISPHPYRRGFVRLVPQQHRRRADEVLDRMNHGLWHWLLGQLVAMAAVALTTAAGLWLIGMPLAVVLGLIAGILNFVPLVGPVLAAIPALLVGFSQSPMDALYVGLLFLGVQQLEGNVLTPLVQRQAVKLPPAVILVSVIVFGVLFGGLGVLLATPLAVAIAVLVKTVYVEDVLGDTATNLP